MWLRETRERLGYTSQAQAVDALRRSGVRIDRATYAGYESEGDLLLSDKPSARRHRLAIENLWGPLPVPAERVPLPDDELPPPWALNLSRALADAIGTAIGEAWARGPQREALEVSDRPGSSATPQGDPPSTDRVHSDADASSKARKGGPRR